MPGTDDRLDIFLSHSHDNEAWVEALGKRLKAAGFQVWLDKWVLTPGGEWQPEMADGLAKARCCVVCIGENPPDGWFSQEIQKAKNRSVEDRSFRVIPVLLPKADPATAKVLFLENITWVNFGVDGDYEYHFYLLQCGIKGERPGPWPPAQRALSEHEQQMEERLRALKKLRDNRLVDDDVAKDLQKEMLRALLSLPQPPAQLIGSLLH